MDINRIAQAGITTGLGNALYGPLGLVSREQMASFLARAMGLSGVIGDRFVDVTSLHEANINAIADAGVTVGCDLAGPRFCPFDAVPREQMATFLVRAKGLTQFTVDPAALYSVLSITGGDTVKISQESSTLFHVLTEGETLEVRPLLPDRFAAAAGLAPFNNLRRRLELAGVPTTAEASAPLTGVIASGRPWWFPGLAIAGCGLLTALSLFMPWVRVGSFSAVPADSLLENFSLSHVALLGAVGVVTTGILMVVGKAKPIIAAWLNVPGAALASYVGGLFARVIRDYEANVADVGDIENDFFGLGGFLGGLVEAFRPSIGIGLWLALAASLAVLALVTVIVSRRPRLARWISDLRASGGRNCWLGRNWAKRGDSGWRWGRRLYAHVTG